MSFVLNSLMTWLGVTVSYVIAAAMVAGGAYLSVLFDLAPTNPLYWLLRPLRWVGIALVAGGLMYGSYTFGRANGLIDGGAEVRREWEQKNLEAEIAQLKIEADARKLAQENAEKALNEIMNQADALQKQVDDYAQEITTLPKILSDCRLSTDDDNRRLCTITGNAAAGCKPATTKRTTRKPRPAPKASPQRRPGSANG